MKQYETFIFEHYAFDPVARRIELTYSLDDEMEFTETIELPRFDYAQCDKEELDAALFGLHLIGGISYFKTCLPKKMEIRSGTLTGDQAQCWNEVYENGLGEFFYHNDIDFRGLIQFPSHPEPASRQANPTNIRHDEVMVRRAHHDTPKLLIPIGGGKDSIVTIELLKNTGYDITLLRVGQNTIVDKMAALAGLPLMNIKRSLSNELFKLNEEGALNGHVPITAYLSFLSVVIALLTDRTHVVWSNEASANIGNVEFHGTHINHQWSKSLAFERLFQAYVETYITQNVTSFSLLRPLSELKITELFCGYPTYASLATSCNRNWKIHKTGEAMNPSRASGSWCGTCPKCAFVFAMMSAFLPKVNVLRIFGKDLFADASLLPLYRELLGLQNFKPFECVGTPEETTAAFLLAHDRAEFEESAAMKMFLDEAMPEVTEPDEMIGEALMMSADHAIPKEFQKYIPT